MRKRCLRATSVCLALVAALVVPEVAAFAADRTGSVSLANPRFEWVSAQATGNNTTYDEDTGEPCGKTQETYCDVTLLHVDVDPAHWQGRRGALVLTADTFSPNPASDFDVYIYSSDAAGTLGSLVDSSTGPIAAAEEVIVGNPSGHYLVRVVYFTVVASSYHGRAELREEEPSPPGPVQYWFHRGDEPVNQLDKIVTTDPYFDTNAPTADVPAVAPDTSVFINTGAGGIGDATWTGLFDRRIETLKVDFWQTAPVHQALTGEVSYDVSLFVGATDQRDLGVVTAPAPVTGVPTRVEHVFTPENTGGVLPLEPGNAAVTVNIGGAFLDGEAVSAILYDSTTHPSGFSINVPASATRGAPPDVDVPSGLQEHLASDPALGFLSHSEPHIARSPVNSNLLVAGSKMYNRDPDSLAEYEFKIGTYVSFDGGRTWSDLGQLAVCPYEDAPLESWPHNACYPEDDPLRDGYDDGESREDLGEEYITSDVWVDFDTAGNAYVMVLDHPPYGRNPEGSGWGMSFHRWESVSPEDVAVGDTWGPRIPINAYTDEVTRSLLLDDKNTFAVNNAPRTDGQPGIIVACWGVSVQPAKQQIVCERSTDGGRTWPGLPLPISDVQALVIGVHVIGDRHDPNRFHATWLQYATGVPQGTPSTLEYATTFDGGVTWIHRPVPVALVNDIPRQFPGQRFRNLSIPITAEGPGGELYITYAEYLSAPDGDNDEDGKQADIMVVKSLDGGLTWGSPVNVTADTGPGTNPNADQFQPYVAVTPSGQVNVAYFDRRMDLRRPDHTGNYYVDVWLSRSNDGGATFSDLRLSHEMTDPELNAPVSPSGLFFGDYQGLVADDCTAVAFFNDSHLANHPARDPNFDAGLPRSNYQQAVSWVVPNTTQHGGTRPGPCGPDLSVAPSGISFFDAGQGKVRIEATIRNEGDRDATGVEVLFTDETESPGDPLGSRQVAVLPAGASATVSIEWYPKGNRKTIGVAADPGDRIAEVDETNNHASRLFLRRTLR